MTKVSKADALAFIQRQMQTHWLVSATVLAASILGVTAFFCIEAIYKVHALGVITMDGVTLALWITNAAHAEMAYRYHSLFEKLAKADSPDPTLYVKRPETANVSAMWKRAETIFYTVAIVGIAMMAI